jgi:ubiquitin C-terminal hydrolase
MNLEKINYEYDFHKHYNLKIKKSTYIGNGLCGLINVGNTCFMNSILQCLSNTPSLTDYFLSASYQDDLSIENKRKHEHFLLMSYLTLINNIWDTNQLIKPKSFFENLSKFHRKYFTLQQQDSHECLLYIMDLLHNSVSYAIDVEINGEPKSKSDELVKKGLETWKKFYENNYSFFIETFNGSTISHIKCNQCNEEDTVFEPFNTLSLDLNELSGSDNLINCLNNYFNSSDNIDTWNCEKCKNKGCTKHTGLWTVPNYLIIHLKRFKQTPNGLSKNNSLVEFPLKDLDITPFISKDKADSDNYIYDLYAVNHHGGGLNGGHYWSSCKNMDGNWYNFNDANVSKYNKATLEQQIVTNDAYILFYHRKFIKKNNGTLLV